MNALDGYAPDAPVGTPNPCSGEPFRYADGVVQCLSDSVLPSSALASSGGTGVMHLLLAVGVLVGIGVALLWLRRDRLKRGF